MRSSVFSASTIARPVSHITSNDEYVWPTESLQNAFRPLRNPRAELLGAA